MTVKDSDSRAGHKNMIACGIPFYSELSAREIHLDFPFREVVQDAGDSGGASSCSTSQGFAGAALPDPHTDP